MTYPPSPIQAATVLRENATMLFAAVSDVFASILLSRQQLQPFCPVETMASPWVEMRGIEPLSETTDFATSWTLYIVAQCWRFVKHSMLCSMPLCHLPLHYLVIPSHENTQQCFAYYTRVLRFRQAVIQTAREEYRILFVSITYGLRCISSLLLSLVKLSHTCSRHPTTRTRLNLFWSTTQLWHRI